MYPFYLTGADTTATREANDFYRTPEWATRALLEREQFDGVVWEPACGDGAISKLLAPGTISTDLIDRGYGQGNVDFLLQSLQVDHIVTNPPYKLAQAFIEHALKCAARKTAMLLKLNFLEGQARYDFFRRTPLQTVYVFSRRLSFDKGDEPGKGNGLLAYAWFVWENGYTGRPQLAWLK